MNNYQKESKLPNVSTRAMASLLLDVEPNKLNELRTKFSTFSYLFETEYKLGKEQAEEHDLLKIDSVKYLALKSLIEETIKISVPAINKIQNTLIKRIVFARKMRLFGSITATVASAGIVASFTASYSTFGFIISFFALIGSICVLIGEHLEKPIIGEAKNLNELAAQLMNTEKSLNEIQIRLLTEDLTKNEILIDITRKANELSSSIKEVSVFGGVSLA